MPKDETIEADEDPLDFHNDFDLSINFKEGINHLNGLPTGDVGKHLKKGLTIKQKIAIVLVLNSLIKEIIFDIE